MKRSLLTTLQFFFAMSYCFSQDILTKKSGEDIYAKILEINQTEIKYKKFDNQNGPILCNTEIRNSDDSL